MRLLYALLASTLTLGQLLCAQPSRAKDIVLVVDVSGMKPMEAGDEPWLMSPCLNPAHRYYKPFEAASSGATYPANRGDAVNASVEYRFGTCFLLEEGAVGWRPWENHYAYDASGALARIEDPEGAGCVYASDLARALARQLIERLLAEDPLCRVALCCVGGPFDTRFCVNFTRDEEKLLSALYAAPPSGIGDPSAALDKAGEYIARRRADERRARRAAVVVLSVDTLEEGMFAERAKEEALRLKESAALVWSSPLEADAEEILRLLGLAARVREAAPARPSPRLPRAAE